MKIWEKIIRFGLVFLVMLSLYFSVNIWISPSKKGQTLKSDSQVDTTVVNERMDTDVFLPLSLVRMQDGKAELNNSENLITNIQNEIKKSHFDALTQVVNENAEQFEKYLSMERGFELLYEGPLLLSEYDKIYHLELTLSSELRNKEIIFTCIQVDLTHNKLRFLDFEHKNIYETAISIDIEKVYNLMNKVGTQYNQIYTQETLQNHHYFLTNELKMKKYSYILASQPVTKFRTAFFSNTKNVQTNEDSKDLSYSNGNERLTVNDELKTVRFNGTLENRKLTATIYSDSFNYIKKLGTSMGNLRYFDRTKMEINYRTFVEGYPVFSENDKGQVSVTIGADKAETSSVSIRTSVDTIQVPIPSEEEVTLASTESVLDQLVLYGADQNKIDSMVIGYTWQKIEETTQVVDLTPEWYIRYDDKWYPERELLEKLANLEVE
jgi:regulatory protein YycH of two-component signal transduction system YycFG